MIYLILNPNSRSGQSVEVWEMAAARLQAEGLTFNPYFTEYHGHASRIARRIASVAVEGQPADTLIVIGGDGTFNEVLNGIPAHTNLRLAFLPVGSGNDLARGLKITRDIDRRLDEIIAADREARAMDQGFMTIYDLPKGMKLGAAAGKKKSLAKRMRSFAISSGIGFDAAACYEAEHGKEKAILNQWHLGSMVYTVAAIKLLFTFKPSIMQLTLDDKAPRKYKKVYFVVAMNLPYEGGGFKFCKDADPEDGKLDFMVVHSLPKFLILFLFPTAYISLHRFIPGIEILRGKRLEILSSHAQHVHCDGEDAGMAKMLVYDVEKNGIQMI